MRESLRNDIKVLVKHQRNNTRANYIKTFIIGLGLCLAIANILYINGKFTVPVPHIALINIEGAIERGSSTGDGLIISNAIKLAMDDDLVKAVIIEANSPGGSPVQAEQLHRTIMSMRHSNSKPIYVSIGEICASACLYIVSAADKVFAHKSSLIGSIGVRMDGWGFDKILSHLDIERRTYSAGEFKALLDPFQPRDPEVDNHLDTFVLSPLYQDFVGAIKEGRGDKLDQQNPLLFTGLIWTGMTAKDLGLVDDIKTHYQVRESLKTHFDVEMIQTYTKSSFDLKKLIMAEFWADVIAKALIKLDVNAATPIMRLE